MPLAEAAEAWALLKFVEEQLERRKADLRHRLLAEVTHKGTVTDKGGYKLHVEGVGQLMRQRRQDKLPDAEALHGILQAAGLDVMEGFREVVTLVPDPSKLDNLVQLGKLTDADVDLSKPVNWALVFRPVEELKAKLDAAKAVLTGSENDPEK
jgi:hypothetical protein